MGSRLELTAFLESLRHSNHHRFPLRIGDAELIADRLDMLVPAWKQRTLADADMLLTRTVRILGEDRVNIQRPSADSPNGGIPWHEDPIHGFRWKENTFYTQVSIPYGRADIRVPWELSRCQHLPTLGMAFAATGERRYADEVAAQIDDWIAANPVGYGVNWSCAMDVAIRAVNWLWSFHMIATAQCATNGFMIRFAASLIAHARHIESNIENYEGGITTNHTLADYVGLMFIGAFLEDLPEGRQWFTLGRQGVLECMDAQVELDGVDFENSIPYHRLVLELFSAAHVLAERRSESFPDRFRSSLERMFDFVQQYTRPDGMAPLIGDSDDGRLQILSRYSSWEPRDHRYLLAVGAVVLARDDLRHAARDVPGGCEEVAWLLGPHAVAELSRAAPAFVLTSQAFEASGRYVLRYGNHHGIVCADETGTSGMGNHKHNDLLSFELSIDGVAFVVDGGSYAYTNDLAWRDRFRQTAAHSTVQVDAIEQNRIRGPFSMGADARVRVHRWQTGPCVDVVDACHTGYERLSKGVTHRRTIVFAKEPFAWLVLDRLGGSGVHEVESRLCLAPGATTAPWANPDKGIVKTAIANVLPYADLTTSIHPRLEAAICCSLDGVDVVVVPIGWRAVRVENGWFAPRYGQREARSVLTFFEQLECPATKGYLLVRRGNF